ncbi:3-deoxy-D-manno-octulosonic acid kinase [Vibrio sp.]|nr:3-deoxy-D-manno-octulosonic acid kinase [Vibrio sp.]
MMKTIHSGKSTIIFDSDLFLDDPLASFDSQYWKAQKNILGSAEGRGTTWFIQTQTLPAALRHYRRGGLFGKLVSDQYWYTTLENTRSYQEYQLLSKLHQQGMPVPRPLAAQIIRSGFIYRADLISEQIQNAKDLVGVLQERALTQEQYINIGQLVKKMHDLQVNHTDLNIHNILLDKNNKLWLIDFDKCGEESGDSWKAGNLARLKRSFIKEVSRFSIHWQESDWQWIMQGYQK